MATESIVLPKEEGALVKLLNAHVNREDSKGVYRRLVWLLYHVYLQGARYFEAFNPRTGVFKYSFNDPFGNLGYKDSKLMDKLNQVIGHFTSMDWRPSVVRGDTSLGAIRERAACQILADSGMPDAAIQRIKPEFTFFYAGLGCVGLCGTVEDHPVVGLVSDPCVIHPAELMPFPSIEVDNTKTCGVLWRRWVPYSFVEERYGKQRVAANKDKMRAIHVPIGEPIGRDSLTLTGGGVGSVNGTEFKGAAIEDPNNSLPGSVESMKVVELRELWINGAHGLCTRYIVQIGDWIAEDTKDDLKTQEYYCPLRIFRFMEDGTFWGQGLCDKIFGPVREREKLLGRFMENLESMDRYDVLVLPTASVDLKNVMRDTGKGLKIVCYAPDPLLDQSSSLRPSTVRQANSGQIPGQAAAYMDQMIEAMSFPEILQGGAPGRVDSLGGLEFLDEQARKSMDVSISNLARGLGELYRSVVCQMLKKGLDSNKAIPVTKLDLSLAGIVIDPQTMTVRMTDIAAPKDLSRMVFTIKDSAPKSMSARKAEMERLLSIGVLDPLSFKVHAAREGIDIEVPMAAVKNAIEKETLNLLVLFGDGQTPGKVVDTPQSRSPEIALMLINEFMQSIAFQRASPEVQNAISDRKEAMEMQLGNVLPENAPNPDDEALLRQAEQLMMQQQAQAGMQTPPQM